jgi:hypothetical protein
MRDLSGANAGRTSGGLKVGWDDHHAVAELLEPRRPVVRYQRVFHGVSCRWRRAIPRRATDVERSVSVRARSRAIESARGASAVVPNDHVSSEAPPPTRFSIGICSRRLDTWRIAAVLLFLSSCAPTTFVPPAPANGAPEATEVGWGDGDYDPAARGTPVLALKAAFRSRASVLHVVGFARKPAWNRGRRATPGGIGAHRAAASPRLYASRIRHSECKRYVFMEAAW